MSTLANPLKRDSRARLGLPSGALAASAVAGALIAAGVLVLGFGDGFAARALVACAAWTAAVALLARRHLPAGSFGAANLVTLVRGAMLAPLVGLLGESPTAAAAWFAVVVAVLALLLDGVDGKLARQSGGATAFGARFDMETDALSILVLAALCWQFGKAGAWILAAGLLRYAFVAATSVRATLGRPLPPSRRRQTVCVVEIVALLLCLSPLLAPPWSAAAGALGLVVLTWSFAIDLLWLLRPA